MNFTTNQFHFGKLRRIMTADLSALGLTTYPEKFSVTSDHTGKIVEFVQDTNAAIFNEFWDGEIMEYIPADQKVNVLKLVLYHR